jgi:hypothetical protein
MKYTPNSLPVMRADHKSEERDDAFRMKANMAAEYLESQIRMAAPTKRRGKQLMKQEFKRGKMDQPAPVENAMEFRRQILSVSLFPNLFNREMVMTHSGVN